MKALSGRLAAVLILVAALVTTALVPTADAATILLSGRVEDQFGVLVPNSVLTLYDAVNEIEIMTIDAVDGTYAAPVEDGIYDVVVEPPTGLGLEILREDLVVLFIDQTRDFVVPSTFAGSIVDGSVLIGGAGVAGVDVYVGGVPTETDATGHFSAELGPNLASAGFSRVQDATTPSFGIDVWLDGNTNTTINLALPGTQVISLTVVDDASGTPVDAEVRVNTALPLFAGLPSNVWASGYWQSVVSTTAGGALLPIFTNNVDPVGISLDLEGGQYHYVEWNGQATQEIRVPNAFNSTTFTVDGTVTAGGVGQAGLEIIGGATLTTTDGAGAFVVQAEPNNYFSLSFTNWMNDLTIAPHYNVQVSVDELAAPTSVAVQLPAITMLDATITDSVSGQLIDAELSISGPVPVSVTGLTPTWMSGDWNTGGRAVGGQVSLPIFDDPTDVLIDVSYEGEYFTVPWDGQNPTTISVATSTKATLSTTVTAGGDPVTSVWFNGQQLQSATGDYSQSQPPTSYASFNLETYDFDPAINLPTVWISGWVDLQTDVHVPIQLPAPKTYTVRLVDAETGLLVDGHIAMSGLMTIPGLGALNDHIAPEDWSTQANTFSGEATFTTLHDGTSPIWIAVTGFGPTENLSWSGDSDVVTLPIRYGHPVPEVPFTVGVPGQNATPIIGESLPFALLACANGTGEWTLSTNGSVVESGVLTETPVGSGEYHGLVPPLTMSAIYDLQSTVDCDGDGTADVTSNQPLDYLDPSGQVFDCQGQPLENVEVTLWRADNATDPLVMVPDGSDIMSPANRANPSYTTATGYYRWDTIEGWYQVRATIPGVGTVSSERLVVPPERFGVDLVFDTVNCAGTTPTATTPPTTPTTTTPTTTPPAAPTTSTRSAIPVQVSVPRPDPVIGEIIGGTLNCHTRMGTYDGEDVMMLVIDVPPILAVWFDPDAKVSITGGGARFNDVLPYGGTVEIPLERTTGEMKLSLRTTLITGASYQVTCPDPVVIPTAE